MKKVSLMRVVIAVCTAKRPSMLRRCLQSLLVQTHRDLEIVVVENDTDPICQSIVEEMSDTEDIPIHYVVERKRGIPIARNRALEEALVREPDWVGLIDDDEIALPNWVETHLATCQKFGADIGHGKVIRHYEDGAVEPKWWKKLKPMAVETGAELKEAATNNILLSCRLISHDGLTLRFDNALTFGCEDIDFFTRAHNAGAKIIWVEEAIVHESIPASRVTPKRLLERAETSGASFAFWMIRRQGRAAAAKKFALKGIRRLLTGLLVAAVGRVLYPFSKEHSNNIYHKGLLRYYRGRGNIRGLLQHNPDYYGKIDGH